AHILPVREDGSLPGLAQDADREVDRAAPLHERDRVVEIDVEPGAEHDGIVSGEAHPHQLAGAPPLDALSFAFDDVGVGRRHPQSP
ncbi:MAG TPA: hypothetical protein VIR14_03075, partial [Gaiellaceae bacterium]